jgi:Cof subfamily protein (haloacid dehalogenase superfamily)
MTASRSTVYVTDLDGTLLGSDARLSEGTREGLSCLLDDGLALTVASARSVVAMQQILEGLELRLPVVEFSGAFVSDFSTGRHLVTNALARDTVEDAYGMILAAGRLPFLSTFDGRSDRLYYSRILNEGMKWYLDDRVANGDPRVQHVDDLSGRLSEEVVCITVIDRPQPLLALCRSLDDRLGDTISMRQYESIYSPGWYWLTIYDAHATKDHGVDLMLDIAGLDGAELVVFGDSDGDISMFRRSDRSIAVANATEDLKAVASEVIGPNTDDSVVRFIENDREKACR